MEYDIVVVGGGVMGASAAYYASRKEYKVLLIDQYPIHNNLNSSQDYSKAFRYEYGDDKLYIDLAVKSLKEWKDLEEKSNQKIYYNCGSLLLGESENDYANVSYKTLKKLGHEAYILNENELKNRFPQFFSKYGVLDPHGGILEASTAVDMFIDLAKDNGVDILENTKVKNIGKNKLKINDDGITYKKLILTCGVWINYLLDKKIPIKPARQQLVYFKPKNIEDFNEEKFPMFGYLDQGFYGFPIHGINAVKVSNHMPGESVDPLDVRREVDSDFIQNCRDFFKDFIPGLVDAEVIKKKVCMYDMTSNEDFIIDRLYKDIAIGTGFSGHGFKFAPIIGEMLSNLVTDDNYDHKIERFKLSSHKF